MFCVECTNPDIKCLYSQFKSKYIKLTICDQCGKLADKYIEFDNVLLFLDVLLLKPQAYRHVAYNVVEESVFGKHGAESSGSCSPSYRQIGRHFILLILFEVYLKWAYEEKSKHHSTMMNLVLHKSDMWQYSFFIASLMVERTTLCGLLYVMFTQLLGWGKEPNRNLSAKHQRPYFFCVLLLAVLMSLIVKCLPIVMLIWPYDNATIASTVVDVVGVFTTIEALKMIADSSYIAIASVVAMATITSVLVKHLVMSFAMEFLEQGVSGATLFRNECHRILAEVGLLRDFAHAFFRSFS